MVRGNLTLPDGRIFYPLQTLPDPPTDPAMLENYKKNMYRFAVADESHDVIGINGKQYIDLNPDYVKSIRYLIHDDWFPDQPEPVEQSFFKQYVMNKCATIVNVANVAPGSIGILDDIVSVPRFNVAGTIQKLIPGGAQQALANVTSQNVDNFYATDAHLGYELPATITPATLYDMASKATQERILDKLKQWWRGAVGVDIHNKPLPCYVDLKEHCITTRDNSYLFFRIDTTAQDGDSMSTDNSTLVVDIQFADTIKTLKFNLTDLLQNNPVITETNGNYLLVSGKDLAKCFFYQIYGSPITYELLKNIECLKKKVPVLKKIQQTGGGKKPIAKKPTAKKPTAKKPIAKTITKPTPPKYALPKYDLAHLLTLLRSSTPLIIGCFLILAKFLGDWLIMATTPTDTCAVSTNDPMLCANNIIHGKKTIFYYYSTIFNTSNIIYFNPTPLGQLIAVPAAAAPKAKKDKVRKKVIKLVKKVPLKKIDFKKIRRKAAITGEQNRRRLLGIPIGDAYQVGGAFPTYVVKEDDLTKTPPQVIEPQVIEPQSITGNKKKIDFYCKGKKLNIDETLGQQKVFKDDKVYIVTSDPSDPSKGDDSLNGINKAYFLFTASFKGMLKEFIDNFIFFSFRSSSSTSSSNRSSNKPS